jgi:hypothetical protein
MSITSTHIDDVLIVRKARRMSAEVRRHYGTPESRQEHREEYVEFLDQAKYHPDVFQRMVDKIQVLLEDTTAGADTVLDRGHF